MATYNIYYEKNRLLKGKEAKIYIRITQNRQLACVDTFLYISLSQVNSKLEIKDDDLLANLLQIRKKYKKWVDDEIGADIGDYKANDLKKFIERKLKGDDIDFFEFANDYLRKMEKEGRTNTAMPIRKSVRGFRDFLKKEKFGCNEITYDLLISFGNHLSKERTIIRPDQYGINRKRKLKPLDCYGVGKYYLNLQSVFNAARDLYNDEDAGIYVIKRNPFKKLEIKVKKPEGSTRSTNIEVVRKVMNLPDTPFKRVNMARDAFILSFMLMGMPPVDMYKVNEYKKGRISYNRSKTQAKRDDNAFYSIKVYAEVNKLIEKYIDPTGEKVFIFSKKYSDPHIFSSNMNKGLKEVQKLCGIDHNLTMYVARHTVGTILRNTFKMPKSDVAECLNHSAGKSVTDYYIKKDFTLIDETIRRLLDYLFEKK